jgi:hypothetical protein
MDETRKQPPRVAGRLSAESVDAGGERDSAGLVDGGLGSAQQVGAWIFTHSEWNRAVRLAAHERWTPHHHGAGRTFTTCWVLGNRPTNGSVSSLPWVLAITSVKWVRDGRVPLTQNGDVWRSRWALMFCASLLLALGCSSTQAAYSGTGASGLEGGTAGRGVRWTPRRRPRGRQSRPPKPIRNRSRPQRVPPPRTEERGRSSAENIISSAWRLAASTRRAGSMAGASASPATIRAMRTAPGPRRLTSLSVSGATSRGAHTLGVVEHGGRCPPVALPRNDPRRSAF